MANSRSWCYAMSKLMTEGDLVDEWMTKKLLYHLWLASVQSCIFCDWLMSKSIELTCNLDVTTPRSITLLTYNHPAAKTLTHLCK